MIVVFVALLCDFGTAASAVESATKPFSIRLLGSICLRLEALGDSKKCQRLQNTARISRCFGSAQQTLGFPTNSCAALRFKAPDTQRAAITTAEDPVVGNSESGYALCSISLHAGKPICDTVCISAHRSSISSPGRKTNIIAPCCHHSVTPLYGKFPRCCWRDYIGVTLDRQMSSEAAKLAGRSLTSSTGGSSCSSSRSRCRESRGGNSGTVNLLFVSLVITVVVTAE